MLKPGLININFIALALVSLLCVAMGVFERKRSKRNRIFCCVAGLLLFIVSLAADFWLS